MKLSGSPRQLNFHTPLAAVTNCRLLGVTNVGFSFPEITWMADIEPKGGAPNHSRSDCRPSTKIRLIVGSYRTQHPNGRTLDSRCFPESTRSRGKRPRSIWRLPNLLLSLALMSRLTDSHVKSPCLIRAEGRGPLPGPNGPLATRPQNPKRLTPSSTDRESRLRDGHKSSCPRISNTVRDQLSQ